MRFSSRNGAFLELSIAGYQFPEFEGEPYDSNWLIIAGQAQVNGRAWKFSDPCLLTGEVSDLADWLDARSKDLATESEISFIEPNLCFSWAQGSLQVDLALECRPPQEPQDPLAEISLHFSPSSDELASAARSLREDLRKYPIRPEREDRLGSRA